MWVNLNCYQSAPPLQRVLSYCVKLWQFSARNILPNNQVFTGSLIDWGNNGCPFIQTEIELLNGLPQHFVSGKCCADIRDSRRMHPNVEI